MMEDEDGKEGRVMEKWTTNTSPWYLPPDECAIVLCEEERAGELEASQCLFEGCHSVLAQLLEGFIQDGCILPLKKTKLGHLRLGEGVVRVLLLERLASCDTPHRGYT